MISNEDLIEANLDQQGHFSVDIRTSMLEQLCDNPRAFEECVKLVLEQPGREPYDPEKLYAFGYLNGSERRGNKRKFVLQKISANGITDTRVVNNWSDSNRNQDGWPVYKVEENDDMVKLYLAELQKSHTFDGMRYVALEVNKKWMVEFNLLEAYCNALPNLSDNDVEDSYDNSLKELIDKNKQIIFTGAPGTGKTFGIRKAIDRLIEENPTAGNSDIDRTKFVQFHSSYDYSDFVEGLRPVSLEEGQNPTFVRMDGVFMKFCRDVAAYNLAILKSENKVTNLDDWYEKCKLSSNASTEDKQQKKDIKNSINATQFYFVIDEINRADIGKVLGELMFGLEEDYRGIENRFETQYANLSTYYRTDDNRFVPYEQRDDVFAKGFFIPENVHIVGSMNNIDRSVDSFDFALRRRFRWHEVTAKDAMQPVLIGSFTERQVSFEIVQLEKLCEYIDKLNTTISGKGKQLGLNESYHIGPAYFKNYEFGEEDENRAKREEIWNAGIKHILREYVNGRNEGEVQAFITKCEKAFIDGIVEA